MKDKSFLMTFAILIIAISAKAQQTSTLTDSRDGKTYKTVKIGNQIWMAENLAYYTNSGCWAYNNEEKNIEKYGYLYNWKTATIVCTSGWHLPSDAEWSILIEFLGGEQGVGGKLKSTSVWDSPNTESTNNSGFSSLPGGYYQADGKFNAIGNTGTWWTSTAINTFNAYYLDMFYKSSIVSRSYTYMDNGFSVRCLKD